MLLPGGSWNGHERRRDYAFRAMTGSVELAIAENAAADIVMPRKVTSVLVEALEHLGGEPPETDRIHGLAVGDRQFLMRRLAHVTGNAASWWTAVCEKCQSRFDIYVDQAELPTKEAGDGFPYTTVDTELGRCQLRVPTGADQEANAPIVDELTAVRALVRRCVVEIENDDGQAEFGDEDIARIDAALDAMAPDVSTTAHTVCPECEHPNHIFIDPYACLAISQETLFDDIHRLAATYHWAEKEILGLPRDRRQTYLRRIDRDWATSRALDEVEGPETWE